MSSPAQSHPYDGPVTATAQVSTEIAATLGRMRLLEGQVLRLPTPPGSAPTDPDLAAAVVLESVLSVPVRNDDRARLTDAWEHVRPGATLLVVLEPARSLAARVTGSLRRTLLAALPDARIDSISRTPAGLLCVALRRRHANPRVAHVTSAHPATDPRIYLKEVGTLREAGYDVTLVAPGTPAPPADDPKIETLPRYTSRLARWTGAWRGALAATRRLDPDVVHFHDPELLPLALVWRAQRRTVIYDAHESLAKDVAYKDYLKPWQSRLLAPIVATTERAIARRVTHVVTATPAIAQQWSFDTTVVANYPILDEWAAIDSSLDNFLARPRQGCYVGAIDPERCTDVIIDAAGRVHPHGTSVVMAGPHAAAEDPAGPGVRYVGVLGRPQVAELVGNCLFGLAIFRPAPNVVEALPTKVLEYMAAGLPVIVSSALEVGSRLVREVGCGLVVPHDDPARVAEAMDTLAGDPRLAHEMGARGRAAVLDRYSWASEGARLVETYRRVVGAPEPGTEA